MTPTTIPALISHTLIYEKLSTVNEEIGKGDRQAPFSRIRGLTADVTLPL